MIEMRLVASSAYFSAYTVEINEDGFGSEFLMLVIDYSEQGILDYVRKHLHIFFVGGEIDFDLDQLKKTIEQSIKKQEDTTVKTDFKDTVANCMPVDALLKNYYIHFQCSDSKVTLNIVSSICDLDQQNPDDSKLQELIGKCLIQDILLVFYQKEFQFQTRCLFESAIADAVWKCLQEEGYYFDIYGRLIDPSIVREQPRDSGLFRYFLEKLLII